MSIRWFWVALGLGACTVPPGVARGPTLPAAIPPGGETEIQVPPLPTAPTIGNAREAFYRRALPTAQRFEAIPIPKEMLLSEDKSSDSYVRAVDGAGSLVGYLRDFSGPVIPGRTSNPHPIAMLLVFDANLELKGLIPASPVLKAGGEALSAAELEQLGALAAAPPAVLSEFPRTSDVVDATTEATRVSLRGAVVAGAAYTSHRVVGLVARTRKLIQRTPRAWDDKRIGAVMGAPANDASVARGLAALLPTLATFERRVAAYRAMARLYAAALGAGSRPDAAVEAMLVHPPLDPGAVNTEVANGCYTLARHQLRSVVVSACVARVTSDSLHPGQDASIARLVGTHRLHRGDAASALAPLRRAAAVYDRAQDPELHLRLVQAAIAAHEGAGECGAARGLFREHPLLPGAREALVACTDETGLLAAQLRRSQRESLVAEKRRDAAPAPVLSLESEDFRTVEVDPAISNKVSVWVFFSTWCPHCATELPRVNAFVRALEARADLRERVRVIGIRTAVEKERTPYDEFLAQVRPEFPVYSDSTMSLVFGQFCRTQNIPPELPTLAVLDSQGVVRFLLASGPYRDTSQELIWAVETLLQP